MRSFTLVNPTTVAEASSALQQANSYVRAGGTDILGVMKDEILPTYPVNIINLKTISGLSYITQSSGVLKIGAMTVLADIATSSIVNASYIALAQAASRVASPHIREMGTIGGNICQMPRCWFFRYEDNNFNCVRKGGSTCYALIGDNRYHSIFGALNGCIAVNPSDMAPALMAMNASIVTNQRTIPAAQFWNMVVNGSTNLAQGEIVTEIDVPTPASGVTSAFIKMALRQSIDFPVVNCASMIGNGAAKICLNAVYNKPYEATAAETSIATTTINTTTAMAAGTAAVATAAPLPSVSTNPGTSWKVQIAKTLVKRTILACAGQYTITS